MHCGPPNQNFGWAVGVGHGPPGPRCSAPPMRVAEPTVEYRGKALVGYLQGDNLKHLAAAAAAIAEKMLAASRLSRNYKISAKPAGG